MWGIGQGDYRSPDHPHATNRDRLEGVVPRIRIYPRGGKAHDLAINNLYGGGHGTPISPNILRPNSPKVVSMDSIMFSHLPALSSS